jgi:ankyrin repeat protein
MKKGWTSLHYALNEENPNINLIEKFITKSKNQKLLVNRLSEDGQSPLTIALKNKNINISIIKLLLEKGVDLYVKDYYNSYIYQTFLYNNSSDITSLLIDYGSILTKKDVIDLKKSEYHLVKDDKKLIKCIENKIYDLNNSIKKYIIIFVKLHKIDKRLINQFIKILN